MQDLNNLFEAYRARKVIETEMSAAEKRYAADRRTEAITMLRETIVPGLRKTAKDVNARGKSASLRATVSTALDTGASFTLLGSHLTFEIETDSSIVIKWIINDNTLNHANKQIERAPILSGAAKHFSVDAELLAFIEAVLNVN